MNFNYNLIKKGKFPYIINRDRCKPWLFYFTSKKINSKCKKKWCTCCKFQTYKAEKLAKIDSKAYWDTSKEKKLSLNSSFFQNLINLTKGITSF